MKLSAKSKVQKKKKFVTTINVRHNSPEEEEVGEETQVDMWKLYA